MNVELEIINETNQNIEEYTNLFETISNYVFKKLKITGEIEFSVSIVDNKRIHEINKEYRNKDTATDVITFALEDYDSPFIEGMPRALGDIFISYDKVVSQAIDYQHSIKREFCFLFVHGLLHLLGYDHIEVEDEKVMNDLQNQILNELEISRV